MAHPSIEKARELLANRDAQETEFATWREQHRNELDDHFVGEMKTKQEQVRKSMEGEQGLVYKTNYEAQPRPQQRTATLKNLKHLSSTIGSRLGQELTKIDATTEELRGQIEELRGEIALLRAMLHGTVTPIDKGKRDAA